GLIVVAKGYWDPLLNQPGLAAEYDLPEFVSAPTRLSPENRPASQAKGYQKRGPTAPPPRFWTPGGLVAVWWWPPGGRRWFHFGDCNGQDAANDLVGLYMFQRLGLVFVGGWVSGVRRAP